MHLLPHLLASNRAAGDGDTAVVAAFLDFSKAYDTVSRPFLYAVMEAMGAGDGLLRWTRAILTGTTASATVNGFTSAAQPYHAGVRQGCPVAPALFLFAAEALVRHLHGCLSVGIDIARGVRVFCVQYADDTLPLLRQLTPACVQAFLAFMHVFQMASRLALNPPKSQLLALGDAVPPDGVLPESVCGLAVVTEAASLGAVDEAGGEPQPDWEELLDQVALKYDKLARLPLSAFGRASAAAAYGVGRLLHRATMHAVPQWVFNRLHRISKRLVDAGPTLPVALPTAEEAAAARAVAACVGWRSGPKTGQEPGRVIPLVGPGGLSVRDATGLQLQGFEGTRRACHTDYVTAALLLSGTPALAASPAVVEAGHASVAIALRRVWMLGCENTLKETLWRITLNDVPGAGGGGIIFTAPCPCGWHPTHGPRPDLMWRSHYFWECRVATAVVGAVRAGLEAKGVLAGALACRHVWLLQPPDVAVYADVWRVVCVAALDAMAYGRRLLWALHLDTGAAPPDDQSLITDFFPVLTAGPAQPDKADHAGRAAVARFWTGLQEIASLDRVSPAWAAADGPPPDHPFIGVTIVTPDNRMLPMLLGAQLLQQLTGTTLA
ncbi:hypothetical protein FOA52_015713 [Chlamydomonas sp. UWO 241]|nr:hypothetical protein FOA52_015713 [Chlamydomonas sp. UWO 241]